MSVISPAGLFVFRHTISVIGANKSMTIMSLLAPKKLALLVVLIAFSPMAIQIQKPLYILPNHPFSIGKRRYKMNCSLGTSQSNTLLRLSYGSTPTKRKGIYGPITSLRTLLAASCASQKLPKTRRRTKTGSRLR